MPPLPNRILSALSPDELRVVAPHLVPLEVKLDQVLLGHGDIVTAVYFPEGMVASAILTMEDGRTAEVGTMGCEGAVGLTGWMGLPRSPTTVIGQIPGTAQMMPLDALKRAAGELPAFASLLTGAHQALAVQAMHSVACNALHSVEERLARWLLMTRDRVQSDDMPLTQQFLAYMLGVYRPSVSVVARTLQQAGLIRYERGSITILDRPGLEDAACEC